MKTRLGKIVAVIVLLELLALWVKHRHRPSAAHRGVPLPASSLFAGRGRSRPGMTPPGPPGAIPPTEIGVPSIPALRVQRLAQKKKFRGAVPRPPDSSR